MIHLYVATVYAHPTLDETDRVTNVSQAGRQPVDGWYAHSTTGAPGPDDDTRVIDSFCLDGRRDGDRAGSVPYRTDFGGHARAIASGVSVPEWGHAVETSMTSLGPFRTFEERAVRALAAALGRLQTPALPGGDT